MRHGIVIKFEEFTPRHDIIHLFYKCEYIGMLSYNYIDLICLISDRDILRNLSNCFRKEVFSLKNYSGVGWDTLDLII